MAFGIDPQYDIDGLVHRTPLRVTHVGIDAVNKNKGVHRLQRAALPVVNLSLHTVRDHRDLLVREAEAVQLLDGLGYIALAHAAGIHGKHLVVDARDVHSALGHNLRLERCVAITRRLDLGLAKAGLDGLGAVAVAAIACGLVALIGLAVAEVGVHLPLQQRFKQRAADLAQHIIDVRCTLDVAVLEKRLGKRYGSGAAFNLLSHVVYSLSGPSAFIQRGGSLHS